MFGLFKGKKSAIAIAWEEKLEQTQQVVASRQTKQIEDELDSLSGDPLAKVIQAKRNTIRAIAKVHQEETIRQARKYGKI